MRAGLFVLGLLMAAQAFAQETPAPPPAQALTAAERCSVDSLAQRATIVTLRADVAKLAARIAELEAPLLAKAVQQERDALEAQFRARLKPPDGSVFNWQTLIFLPPAPALERK